MNENQNNDDLFEYTKDLNELKNKLFDSEHYSTMIIDNEGELEGGFDKFFDFTTKRENIEFKEDALAIFKQEVSIDAIFDYLSVEADEKKRTLILSAVWEAGLDATKHISKWIDIAIKGSFEECIEVLSIIENIEVTQDANEIATAQHKLNTAKKLDENTEKSGLLDALEEALNFLKEN